MSWLRETGLRCWTSRFGNRTRRRVAPFLRGRSRRAGVRSALDIRHARRSATGKDVAIPTQYLVHRDGVVCWFYRDESIRLRPHPREALAAIRESVSIPLTK